MESQKTETRERQSKSPEEVFIRTNKGILRAEFIERKGPEIFVRIIWSHDGQGVGNILRIDTTALGANKPIRFSGSRDGGKSFTSEQETSGTLELITKWEKGQHITVDDLIAHTEQHIASEHLPENPFELKLTGRATQEIFDIAEAEYRSALPEYEFADEAKKYADANPEKKKFNFAFGDGNFGWKVHINVTPDKVLRTSDYLKNNGYYHKYLSGGEGSLGKAFTVYFGAKSSMDKWSNMISQDLAGVLCKPIEKDEVEVASGIVARFVVNDKDKTFLQYGANGVSIRRDFFEDKNGLNRKMPKTVEDKRTAVRDAYNHLSEKFGSYFNG